jgi:hypothetical protein
MSDKLNEMWTALAAYQPKAVADGHGESWALMCSERNKDATYATYASWDAAAAGHAANAAYYATYATYYARDYAADRVEYYAQRAIDCINKAK